MHWNFVGRNEQLESIRVSLRARVAGPIIIEGERGMGRTALLERALESEEASSFEIVRVEASEPASGVAARVPANGRQLLLVVDDAHLSDHATLLSLRDMCRRGAGTLLVTTAPEGSVPHPDPADSLRFEPHRRNVHLPPLALDDVTTLLADIIGGHVRHATAEALHAASGGSPALLRELITSCDLGVHFVLRNNLWEFREVSTWTSGGTRRSLELLSKATTQAWYELQLERAHELCKAAVWCGAGEMVAPVLAHLLLLHCRAQDVVDFLDSMPDDTVETTPHLALAKAMAMAFGLGQPMGAEDFLLKAALLRGPRPGGRYLAYRSWIQALTGRGSEGSAGIGNVDRDDRETALFVHAARATATIATDPHEAVFHLRRALALGNCGVDAGPPWLSPYITACLIDALLLAGRSGEATLLASDFHGGEQNSGWDVAVAISTLTGQGRTKVTGGVEAA
ncbi:hypothetical protein [Sphaerisporangium sp. NPDC051011]|uniref:hypothetical protein n=1 Tax=Sphaerisporangium sp. NPDC051011 TaxID=3155792 RepID=UPI0034007C37